MDKPKNPTKTCQRCAFTFAQKRPWQIFCSTKCRIAAYSELEAARVSRLEERHDLYEKEVERLSQENLVLRQENERLKAQ